MYQVLVTASLCEVLNIALGFRLKEDSPTKVPDIIRPYVKALAWNSLVLFFKVAISYDKAESYGFILRLHRTWPSSIIFGV